MLIPVPSLLRLVSNIINILHVVCGYVLEITFAQILTLNHCVLDLHSGNGACYFISVLVKT